MNQKIFELMEKIPFFMTYAWQLSHFSVWLPHWFLWFCKEDETTSKPQNSQVSGFI